MRVLMEQWKSIPSYDGYEASNLGRIRNAQTGRVLKCKPRKGNRYALVHVGWNYARQGPRGTYPRRRVRMRLVHVLVAAAWNGPCPPGHEVNHKDTDRSNNRADNLEYVTHKRNMQHAAEMGLLRAPRPRKPRTHCLKGHPLEGENLVVCKVKGRDVRTCRICRNANARRKWGSQNPKDPYAVTRGLECGF